MAGFLLFNIGNTHTQWIFADKNGRFCSDAASASTAEWMHNSEILPDAGDCAVWVACVVPEAGKLLQKTEKYSCVNFVNAQTAACAGLDFSQVDASTLGADRIANAAALVLGDLPAACIDFGTAITMEAVLPGGIFAGGAIMPGRKLMRKSLAAGTAALPELALSDSLPDKLGTTTLTALALGIDRGAVGMTRELMRVAEKQYGVQKFYAAGGDADFFCKAIDELVDAEKLFTLRGVGVIACKHAE